MEDLVKTLRKSFNTNETKSLKWRKDQLMAIDRMVDENKAEFCEALRKDLNKPEQETIIMELGLLKNSITHALANIDSWTKPQKVVPIVQARALYSTHIQHQPLGIVLVIGAWNYPIQLTLVPLVGVLMSGNCAIVKPSELSPATAALLEKIWTKYFDPTFVALVNGGISETTELLKQRFDHIFYTGNSTVGKIIMKAAANYMTPVTLECGGKSPVYIDPSADLNVSAKRILWGKFANAGQTCVAPDYVLCTKETQDKLLPLIKKHLADFYGENAKESQSFGRIINERHFKRLIDLIDEKKVVHGGDSDDAQKYIGPTVMFDVTSDDKIMQDEIFGPILPFLTVKNHQDAIQFINEREKPLTLYVFSNDFGIVEEFKNYTTSGSIAINECLMQISFECVPFGGVGNSGVGNYHGKFSLDTFSHQRSILTASLSGDFMTFFRYPPYSEKKTYNASLATSEMRSCNIL